MTDLLTKSYDEIPYPSVPFVQSHPDRLATIATLYGMDPAPPSPESCRVLELGCAQGDNLIPLAMGTPRGEFVGIDLSPRQIADGQAVVAELGVENVRLEEMNLMDLDASWGEFDYILAHGVFSWVPDDVREGMLKLCRERLKPNGIAYISYNTLPGWRLRGAVRDMLRFHTRNVEGSRRQLTEGQAALDFFAEGIPEDQGLYRFIFQNVREDARDPEVESHLYHDFMEEFNQPFYFQEFIGRAARHDLQFLGEADASDSQPQRFNDQVQQMLASLDESYHLREQYVDFLINRTFRQSLVGRREVQVDRVIRPERIKGLHVESGCVPVDPDASLGDSQSLDFQDRQGVTLEVSHPLTKAALAILGESWPRAIPFAELEQQARARLAAEAKSAPVAVQQEEETLALAKRLLSGYAAGAVEFHARPPAFAAEISDRPRASAWAARQARRGTRITNLRHNGVQLPNLNRRLLPFLNGRNTKEEIVGEFARDLFANNQLVLQEGRPIQDLNGLHDVLATTINQDLERFLKASLLEG